MGPRGRALPWHAEVPGFDPQHQKEGGALKWTDGCLFIKVMRDTVYLIYIIGK